MCFVPNIFLKKKKFVFSEVFSNLVVHSFDQSAFDSHRVLLIKSIIERYLNVRISYLSKATKNNETSIRHHSNKIVLFKGQ